jgi:hypothetical protein
VVGNDRSWRLATEAKPLRLRSLLGVLRTLRVGRLALPPTRLSSRAEEFHLRALPEPYVNLSIHTAPDVRPLP